MPIPALVGAAAPYAIPALISLFSTLFSRSGQARQSGSRQSSGLGMGFTPVSQSGGYTSKFAPFQMSALQQLLGQGLGGLQQLQQPFDFGPIEQQARQGFSQQTVPELAERFTGLGAGSQGSSAFAQLLGRSGADLESSLAALRSQYGLQDLGRRQNLATNQLQFGLQSPYGDYIQRTPGFWENLATPLLSGAASAGTAYGINALQNLGGR